MEFIKRLLVLGSISVVTLASGQISNGKVEPKKEEVKKTPEKALRVKREQVDGMDEFSIYVGAGRSWTNRTLKPNDFPFGRPLGTRADETGLKTWCFNIGVRNRISHFLSYDIGFGVNRFGDGYTYDDPNSDSTLTYKTKYSSYTIPVQVFATFGKDVRFFIGGGLQPELSLGYRQKTEWTNKLDGTGKTDVKTREGINPVNMDVLLSAGVQMRLAKVFSLYLMPTMMWGINDIYDKQSHYKYYPRAFTVKFGLIFHIPDSGTATE